MTVHGRDCRSGGEERGMGGGGEGEEGGEGVNTLKSSIAPIRNGSKTEGFRNLLDLYRDLHNIGYRCYMDLPAFISEMMSIRVRK